MIDNILKYRINRVTYWIAHILSLLFVICYMITHPIPPMLLLGMSIVLVVFCVFGLIGYLSHRYELKN